MPAAELPGGGMHGAAPGVRDALLGGRRHVFEAEMKERRRTDGQRHHEAAPGAAATAAPGG